MNFQCAMPISMKIAIMVQEGLRRLLNTSPEMVENVKKLLLREFNKSMRAAGYAQNIRISVTEKILQKYRERCERDQNGQKPMYRNRAECKADKLEKGVGKSNWFKKGNRQYDGVLRVPSTPGSTLSKRIRDRLRREELEVKILIQEQVGTRIRDMMTNSRDPWGKSDCRRDNCMLCPSGKLGKCWKMGATYKLECLRCETTNSKATYTGESGRPLHTRLAEHRSGLLLKSKQNVLHAHNMHMHPMEVMVPEDWSASCTGTYKTPLERQTAEGVLLVEEMKKARSMKGNMVVLNSKMDWVQTALVQTLPQRISNMLNS